MVDSHKYLVYNNVEDRNIFLSDKDESLIHFARMIRDENEDDEIVIMNIDDAIAYINEFCGNLDLQIN